MINKLYGMLIIGTNLITMVVGARILGVGILLGNDKDSDGCISSAGYEWCEYTQECIRVGENNCPSISDQ